MLSLAAIVPHSPLLIPQIGKDNRNRLENTILSFQKIAQKIIDLNISTIIVISPHGEIDADNFIINQNTKYQADFSEFGDFSTNKTWKGSLGLAYEIKNIPKPINNLKLNSYDKLDYGSSVPLLLLTEKIPNIKIIPLYYSELNMEKHFKFGKKLLKPIQRSPENVAVIASGDLSHRLTKDAPGGYSPKGNKFDNKLIEFIKNKKTREILDWDEKFIIDAGECGLRSILILLGLLSHVKYKPKMLSYEYPFGVGCLTMDFNL